ncbi:hypothetical protein EBM89_17540 [Cellulomonas triticagri]|uniref:Lipoprotein n=1 Tax=Cellulomonas triticagri TaxID=2483352 RepID=A0A3M2IWJ5_9CELL|nr:hypothetical protein EBM89_17540 [Cellulomonas triticagri]
MVTRKSYRRVVPALGALVVAATLTACGGGQPGAAALVGDRAVPSADVTAVTRDLTAIAGDAAPSSTIVLIALAQAPAVLEHTEEAGLGYSDQQARDDLAAQTGGDPEDFADATVTYVRTNAAIQALQSAPDAQAIATAISEDLASDGIEFNPRFGTLTDEGAVVSTTYPWLVPTAAAVAP